MVCWFINLAQCFQRENRADEGDPEIFENSIKNRSKTEISAIIAKFGKQLAAARMRTYEWKWLLNRIKWKMASQPRGMNYFLGVWNYCELFSIFP